MKTWNDIETRLRQEATPVPSADLHHSILRAVREDRAAAIATQRPHRSPAFWLLASAATCALVLTLVQFRPAPENPDLGSPALSFAMLETFAASPVENEWTNLRSDLASAAQFVSDCVPTVSAGADTL